MSTDGSRVRLVWMPKVFKQRQNSCLRLKLRPPLNHLWQSRRSWLHYFRFFSDSKAAMQLSNTPAIRLLKSSAWAKLTDGKESEHILEMNMSFSVVLNRKGYLVFGFWSGELGDNMFGIQLLLLANETPTSSLLWEVFLRRIRIGGECMSVERWWMPMLVTISKTEYYSGRVTN